MDSRRVSAYLYSLPERVVRSLAALAGGVVREVGEHTLPARVRRTRLYRVLVDSTLRFIIEDIGQVAGAYPEQADALENFLVRRTAGNVLEMAGIVAFRASPVWVLAALADVSGAGRDLIFEIAEELKREGLLEPGRRFETVDQLLDGLEHMAGRLAETVNTPPLDVAGLRAEWSKVREEARRMPRASIPAPGLVWSRWREAKQVAAAQHRSVFQISAAMAVSAIRELPDDARWLSRAAVITARRTGQVLAQGLLDHYSAALAEIRETGFLTYWAREFRPYFAGALQQFSPNRASLTERLLNRPRA
jgi:hypothetical protein